MKLNPKKNSRKSRVSRKKKKEKKKKINKMKRKTLRRKRRKKEKKKKKKTTRRSNAVLPVLRLFSGGVRKLPPQARNSPRREVVRRFLTRDKILGSTLKRLSTPGPGYCFNVFESNIDASWARKPAWNETERKRREWRARGRGTRYRESEGEAVKERERERQAERRDGTTHITSTREHEKGRRLAVTKEQEAKRNERKKNAAFFIPGCLLFYRLAASISEMFPSATLKRSDATIADFVERLLEVDCRFLRRFIVSEMCNLKDRIVSSGKHYILNIFNFVKVNAEKFAVWL